ncbi:MAG TPA: hypothetical protein VNU72_02470, partial [Puia sp.]|nr:hypothetical protein [Puia sp.]
MKKSFLLFILCITCLVTWSQDQALQLVNPLPVSPQAASFTKYGDIPVSLNSGVANISIPVFSIKTGALNFPISLSYNPSGIKIEELASDVGLGWNLNSTAMITREVRGLPDEQNNGWFNDSSYVHAYIDGIEHGTMSAANQEIFLSTWRTGTIDGETDIYYFNIPGGGSGKFFSDGPNHFVSYPRNNFKIEAVTPSLASWKITTDEGIQYFFNAEEITNSTTSSSSNGGGFTDGVQTTAPTSWYVTKIIDP